MKLRNSISIWVLLQRVHKLSLRGSLRANRVSSGQQQWRNWMRKTENVYASWASGSKLHDTKTKKSKKQKIRRHNLKIHENLKVCILSYFVSTFLVLKLQPTKSL